MRNLALLIRKDWMSITSTNPGFLIMIAIIWLVTMFSAYAVPFIFVMTVYVLVVTMFSMEENDLVCNVAAVLPIRKRDAVLARYVYMYLILGAQVLLCTILLLAGHLIGIMERETLAEYPGPILLSLNACLVMLSIIMPLAYRFGYTKMRMLITIIYIAAFAVSAGIAPIFTEMIAIQPAGTAASLPILFGTTGVCVLLSFISMAASIRAVQ